LAEEQNLTDILLTNRVVRHRRDPSELLPVPELKKRKLSDIDAETFESGNGHSDEEVTEMYFPFVRGHYTNKNAGKEGPFKYSETRLKRTRF
jgi:hypothetical protein